jgi:hypothetical protein
VNTETDIPSNGNKISGRISFAMFEAKGALAKQSVKANNISIFMDLIIS